MKEPRFNSASRLLAIIEKSRAGNAGHMAITVWATALGVTETDNTLRFHQVHDSIKAMYEENELMGSFFANSHIDSEAYQPAINAIRASLNPELLMQHWSNTFNFYNEVPIALKWMRSSMPTDSFIIPSEEREQLIHELETLKLNMLSSDIPEDIKRYLQRHIVILLNALRTYEIVGARALRDALVLAHANQIYNEDTHQQAKNNEKAQDTVQQLFRIYSWVMARAGDAANVYTLVDAGLKILKGGS